MSAYSNTEIVAAVDDGSIVIHPFDPGQVNGSSYDVTLGYFYYRVETISDRTVYNPFDQTDVERYFDGYYKATEHGKWCEENGIVPLKHIPLDHPVIALGPGERILAHTHEYIGIKPPGTSSMQARSTWGRNGIAVCLDAGWGDPGYINRWTMEIYNMNQRETVLLPVGERIAQLVFYRTGEVKKSYESLSGKYQSDTSLEKLIKMWSPDMMLPKAWKDQRKIPTVIAGALYE